MQTTDLLNLYVIAASNAVLVRHDSPDFSTLSALMKVALTPAPSGHSQLSFKIAEKSLSWIEWIQDLKQRGAQGLKLVSLKDLSQPVNPAASPELPEAQMHGFDGTSPLVLVVLWADRAEAWQVRILYPRETDLQVSDLLTFLAESNCANALKSSLLWENAHNLHYYETEAWKASVAALKPKGDEKSIRSQQFASLFSYWEPFIKSISEDRIENLIKTFGRCCGNTEIPEIEADRWFALCEQHTQEGGLSFLYERIGAFGRTLPLHPVEEAVSSLREGLRGIAAYADAKGEKQWGDFFREGIQWLEQLPANAPGPLTNPLRALKSSEDALRLLSAALFVSDAFGGMGTWNDIPIYQEPEYEQRSNEVLKAINNALVAGASLL